MTPWELTFLVECSFLVFSTNKQQVIISFASIKKIESGNFLILKTKFESLNFIEFLIPYPLFISYCIST